MNYWPKGKVFLLVLVVAAYVALGVFLKWMVISGHLEALPPTPVGQAGNDTSEDIVPTGAAVNLAAAKRFFDKNLVRTDGHIDLYHEVNENGTRAQDANTNSEAMSYHLLWAAQAGDKASFDRALTFIEKRMIHPETGYMQWRVTEDGRIVDDGGNIASDADLRAIKALLIAEDSWRDARYTSLIDKLAKGLERTAITKDGYLAPYGGGPPDNPWVADESWLSYSDFTVFRALSARRGEPWTTVHANMKAAVLGAQIHNGLYNSQLTQAREYGNGIDGSGYSINSLWVMVRAAESGDPELMASANRSLEFYRGQFTTNNELYALYSSNGDAMSPTDAPWVYALVGRAAVALGDDEFAGKMMRKLFEHQVTDCSSQLYGAFPEGDSNSSTGGLRVGQFTMQEAIITIQDYLLARGESLNASPNACGSGSMALKT